MTKIILILISCCVLLFLSAFFSSSETALFSLSEHEVDTLSTGDRKRKRFYRKLTKEPHALLSTVLLSNTVVNVAFSFLITLLFLELLPRIRMNARLVMAMSTVLIALCLLIFGEFTPKFYALRRNQALSRRSALPLYYLMLVLRPIILLLGLVNHLVKRLLRKKRVSELSFSEVKTLFELSEQQGILKGRERDLLRSLFTLRELNVSEIMIPRKRIFAMDGKTTIGNARDLLLTQPHSRIPVYGENEERIEGILYLKDLLIHRKDEEKQINTVLREPIFVPESMKLKDLFLEFRNKRIHFALVVNEFGGVEGIVTMHDILEEIVGDIKEEFPKKPIAQYRFLSPHTVLVDGELRIDDFPGLFSKELPRGDYDTISGFILAELGRVPEEDEVLDLGDLRITVVKTEGQKLEKLLIKKIRQEDKP
jgi:CBS domain containing-hemolysin-like protein